MLAHRYCSPIWRRKGERFIPEEWSKIRYSRRVHSIIDDIKNHIIDKETPVFVRGSLIEEKKPHPKSDIDIIVVPSQRKNEIISPDIHRSFQQMIDINLL